MFAARKFSNFSTLLYLLCQGLILVKGTFENLSETPIAFPCPDKNLVVECTTMSAPCSKGRQRYGVAMVLSMMRGIPVCVYVLYCVYLFLLFVFIYRLCVVDHERDPCMRVCAVLCISVLIICFYLSPLCCR